MTTNSQGQSAKIYTFPLRGRFAVGGQHSESRPNAGLSPARGVHVASESSWYHEEAIREAERTRKN